MDKIKISYGGGTLEISGGTVDISVDISVDSHSSITLNGEPLDAGTETSYDPLTLRHIMLLLHPDCKIRLIHYVNGTELEACTADELMRGDWYATLYRDALLHSISVSAAGELVIGITDPEYPELSEREGK